MSKARDLADSYTDSEINNKPSGFKNLIINGGFDVWQRGTSFTVTNGYTADRWKGWNGTFELSTDVPNNASIHSMKVTVTSQASGSFSNIETLLEDERRYAGNTYTKSFWVKGSTTGTIVARGYSQSNNGGYVHTEIPVTTTWTKHTITYTLPSLGGGTFDWWADGFDFNVNNIPGLSYSGSGVSEPSYIGDIYITQVQLELGSVATPFEQRPYGLELSLCQRYYESSYSSDGVVGADNQTVAQTGYMFQYDHPGGGTIYYLRKRIAPTVTIYAPLTTSPAGKVRNSSNGAINTVSGLLPTQNCTQFNVDSGAAIGYQCGFTADAEL